MDLSFVGEDYSHYAGFWRRFGAYWIDVIVWLPLTFLSFFLNEKARLFQVYWLIPSALIGLWFHVYLVGRYGGTPGKLAMKIRIAMTDGSPVTFTAAAIRYSVLCVLGLLLGVALAMAALAMSDAEYFSLGFMQRSQRLVALAPPWYGTVNLLLQIWIWGEFVTLLFNKKRRAVHDFLAGTVVVRVSPEPVLTAGTTTLPA